MKYDALDYAGLVIVRTVVVVLAGCGGLVLYAAAKASGAL